jgi:hypothetical protein
MEIHDGGNVSCIIPGPLPFCHPDHRVLGAGRIPVYILNALYLAPLTLWTYLNLAGQVSPARTVGHHNRTTCAIADLITERAPRGTLAQKTREKL